MRYNKEFRDEAMKLWEGMRFNSLDFSPSITPYAEVEKRTGVPDVVIAAIHGLESGGDFNTHLHNGDPLTERTTHVPRGRPKDGEPPFNWVDSACDALTTRWVDWSIPGMLYFLERYNGWGYRQHGINSPYIWSGTNQYTKGKYVSDGHFDSRAVSKQVGAARVLEELVDRWYWNTPPKTPYYLGQKHPQVITLQSTLLDYNLPLVVDGWLGRRTAKAFNEVFDVRDSE